LEGIEHLRRAKAELAAGGDLRTRLRAAARAFWSAAFFYESWPPAMQRRAADMLPRLFRKGAITESVRTMSDPSMEALSGEIRAFCEEADRHERGAPRSPRER
jgi:hypothetical protein